MSRLRRTAVHLFLVGFTLWPALHIGLVLRYDLNPWKLAGWGMYSAPQWIPEVKLIGLTADEVGSYELRNPPLELQQPLDRFRRRRLALRRLARPDGLAAEVLDHYPAIRGVRVEVVQPVMDPATGIVERKTSVYEYGRTSGS